MNSQELTTRLTILSVQDVIDEQAGTITTQAFENLKVLLETDDVKQAEMLFTHLPAALTRIDSQSDIEGPSEEVLSEIKESPYFTLAERQVRTIEEVNGAAFPQSEFDYLLLHYTTVITINKGGN